MAQSHSIPSVVPYFPLPFPPSQGISQLETLGISQRPSTAPPAKYTLHASEAGRLRHPVPLLVIAIPLAEHDLNNWHADHLNHALNHLVRSSRVFILSLLALMHF